jgi:hypothetical protein
MEMRCVLSPSPSALREGGLRSSDVTETDLLALQMELSIASDREDAEVALLVAEAGPHSSVTLGFIAPRDAHWWSVSARGWNDLLNFDPLRADHAARRALARRV